MDWDNPEWSEPATPPAKRGGPRGAMPRRGFAPFKHTHQEARKVDDNERRFGLRDWEGSRRRAAPSRGARGPRGCGRGCGAPFPQRLQGPVFPGSPAPRPSVMANGASLLSAVLTGEAARPSVTLRGPRVAVGPVGRGRAVSPEPRRTPKTVQGRACKDLINGSRVYYMVNNLPDNIGVK